MPLRFIGCLLLENHKFSNDFSIYTKVMWVTRFTSILRNSTLTTLIFLIPKSHAYSMDSMLNFKCVSFKFNSLFKSHLRCYKAWFYFKALLCFWMNFKMTLGSKLMKKKRSTGGNFDSLFHEIFHSKRFNSNYTFYTVPFESWTTLKKLKVIFYLFTQFIILILKVCRAEVNWWENKTLI